MTFESKPYVVGKRYPVTEVYGQFFKKVGWWPVMGELHEDKDVIGFTPLHYHIDWRFASEARLRYLMKQSYARWQGHTAQFVFPLAMDEGSAPLKAGPRNYFTRSRRLKFKREFPSYPHGGAPWMGKLEAKFAHACLMRGVCPHRGYDLTREPVRDGVVTCPLHGLRWNVETGRVHMPQPSSPTPAFTKSLAEANA